MGGGQPPEDNENEAEGHLPYERMEAYVDGRLGRKETAAVEEHILWCAPCAAELADLRMFCAHLATLPDAFAEYAPQGGTYVSAERDSRTIPAVGGKVFRGRLFEAVVLPHRCPTCRCSTLGTLLLAGALIGSTLAGVAAHRGRQNRGALFQTLS